MHAVCGPDADVHFMMVQTVNSYAPLGPADLPGLVESA
jgi:hypothetical protein